MKSKQVRTFMISGIPGVNLQASHMDDDINEWLNDNPGIEIEEKILDTSTTTFSPEGGRLHQTVVTICLLVVYRPSTL